jgi:hypothetical protein
MPDGYTSSAAKGVNDNMEIVGSCGVPIDKSMPSRLPCLWRHGDVFDVNTLLIQHSGVLRLTTAASIFFSAGIGIAVALEQYYLAVGVALAILVINLVVGHLEHWLIDRHKRGRS